MALLEFSSVSYGFTDTTILTGVSGALHPGNIIGLVGANGGGKTTLLRLLTGELASQGGRVQRQKGLQLAYVGQSVGGNDDEPLSAYVREGRADLLRLEAEQHRISEELAQHPGDSALLARLGEMQSQFGMLGGHRWDSDVQRLLTGLSFATAELEQRLGSLSGGQRQKAALARVLLAAGQCLIFDEPTNHLDLDAQEFFADYVRQLAAVRSEDSALAQGRRGVILVSHDRWLLDRLCTHLWELEDGALYRYTGNYAQYVPQREMRRSQAQQAFARQQEQIARTEDYIRRNIAGQNTKQAQGRRTLLARMEQMDKPSADPQMAFVLKPAVPTGEQVLVVEDLKFSYAGRGGALSPPELDEPEIGGRLGAPPTHVSAGHSGLELNPPLDYRQGTSQEDAGRTLLSGLTFTLYRGERLGIVGPNGCGKTTLLKLLTRQLAPERGLAAWGSNAQLGVFSQDSADLRAGRDVLAELREVEPMISDGEARGYLARFGFSGDDVYKDAGMLSGGERSRLSLAKIFRRRPNVLVLDEPTNHLDIYAREALEQFLDAYEGTIVMVTHDRALLERLSNRLVTFERNAADEMRFNVTFYRGGFSDYVRWRDGSVHGGDAAQSKLSAGGNIAVAGLQLPQDESNNEQPLPIIDLTVAQIRDAARSQRVSVDAYCRKQASREERRANDVEARIAEVELHITDLTRLQRDADTKGSYGEIARLQDLVDAASDELHQHFEQLEALHLRIEAWMHAIDAR